jgi:hypothetical protein
MSLPPPTPAEYFATLLAWLTRAVAAMSGGDRLPYLLIGQIAGRLRNIKQRVARLAARIGAGRYVRRTVAPHPRAAGPRRADPLPKKFGWLLPLVPDAICFRAQLETLLLEPATVELMQAAPASLARPLRSLCRMLGLRPPSILALPPRPRPARKTPAAAPALPPPAPPPPQPPAWMPKRTRWTLTRIRGSPNRA